MRENIFLARERLDNDFAGSKEAMLEIALDKVKQFQIASDTIIECEEKEILTLLILAGMFQAFSLGYGIGKVEGETLKKIIL
ncbi:MAG: hypothetical protein GX066_00755 [Clostridiaceae bacterium]|nr:hypothetical protein [Clostridiaceae bacterium]